MRASISKLLIPAVALCAMLAGSQACAQDGVRRVYHNAVSVRYMIRDLGHESKAFRHKFEQRYDAMFQSDWRRSDDSRHAVQEMDKALEVVTRRDASGEKARYFRDDVKRVIDRAGILDRRFRHPDEVLASMHDDWEQLKSSLNDLAASYDLPDVGT